MLLFLSVAVQRSILAGQQMVGSANGWFVGACSLHNRFTHTGKWAVFVLDEL